ncbi:MAG: C4-type zinc ribbon domain-containing protein [Deltaproteobacteria bacterium]|nr:C4-type zinc ribbon domain-containing protein [Deltaproteobacteria bacterium]
MKETIRTLIDLQRLDNQIAQWRRVVAEGPDLLTQARLKLTAVEQEAADVQSQIDANLLRRQVLETELTDLADRKTMNLTRQLKAKNNEEYRAVLKEADSIATQLVTREEELLGLMEEAEKLGALAPKLQKEVTTETKLFTTVAKSLEKDMAASQKKERQAQVDRARLTESLPRDVLGRYLIVSKNRDGQALAEVSENGMCRACRLSVPPQLFNELQRNDKLLSCPNCARIIYWPDHPDLKPQEEETPENSSLKAHG